MNARPAPPEVRRIQFEASDPRISAWVAANAGSGKTYVLAQRVIRLMLAGTQPAKILCLTFTKAAAANMANQVLATLAAWTGFNDSKLEGEIAKIEGEPPDEVRLARARRLFAEAIETPGGLRVQTIHAFCTSVLYQFPFEANVAARFTVLDERAQSDLLGRLRLEVLLEAAALPKSALGRALSTAIAATADRTFGEAIDEAVRARDALTAFLARAGSIDAAAAEISAALGVPADKTIDQVEDAMTHSPVLPASEWPAIASILNTGGARDREQAQRLTAAAAAVGPARVEPYLAVFLTAEREPRKAIVTRPFERCHADVADRLKAEQARLMELVEQQHAIAARDRSVALLTVADAMIGRYRREKEHRGLLDYDDLIDKTLALMERVDAAWVHYKLDLGIDHVLIDEAQDTSPKQWAIIKKLVAEFTAGESARGAKPRSIFAVGDEKQSIFSFQGAAPREFADAHKHFERSHRQGELEFHHCRFRFSFRSGPNVLTAVDAVFRDRQIQASITSDEVPPLHEWLPDAAPGLVEIWPLVNSEKPREIDGWDAPFDELSEANPQLKLARRIANSIGAWIGRGRSPGDVLVLVRQRGPLFEAIIRALKNAHIAVAGADRLVLTEHIAVMDLMALADALLCPGDDLALATVLKSPLFGLDEDDLFTLAFGRRGSLRAALQARACDDPRFAPTSANLDRLAELARNERPFGFYARLLGADGGRKRILARLGAEATDAIDEFLNLALDYEACMTPSLQGFVAWLRTASTQVKRDMDIVRNEVRVMTVHGAKGLEAPIVILADTTTRPTGPRDPRLLMLPAIGAPPGAPPCPVWGGAQRTDVGAIAAARAQARRAAEDEHRRLLYVAMTRAADRLIVCGTQGLGKRPECCWYDLVRNALAREAKEEPAEDGDGNVWRWRPAASDQADSMPALSPESPSVLEIPPWLIGIASAPETRPRVVSPSTASRHVGHAPRQPVSGHDREPSAMARGLIVHRLLQALPHIPHDRRALAAHRYLVRVGAHFDAAECSRIVEEILAIITDTRFAPLFAAGTRAEVPIVGRIRRHGFPVLTVSGQIDRLAVTPAAIYIADYKTNRPAPRRIDDVPSAYMTQLALYRAVLSQLFSDRPVHAALVWTDIPDLMILPDTALEDALATVVERGGPMASPQSICQDHRSDRLAGHADHGSSAPS
jgi:ATP-dependent helicase/nuclease subunit A